MVFSTGFTVIGREFACEMKLEGIILWESGRKLGDILLACFGSLKICNNFLGRYECLIQENDI